MVRLYHTLTRESNQDILSCFMQKISRQIYKRLEAAKQIIIIPHQNPDGDALGSLSALTEHLRSIGKKPKLFCTTPPHKKFFFIKYISNIETDPDILKTDALIILLDSGDLRYAGVAKFLEKDAEIVNIDHHPTNDNYGEYNLVSPESSSTAELIYHFFRHNRLPINHHIATALLTGIITDTDNFSNPATTTSALKAASELLRHGGNLNLINKWIIKNKTFNALKLWGVALSRLDKHENSQMIYTYITREDLKKLNASESEAEGIANFLNNLEEAKISLIVRETEDGKIKASFRTTQNNVDVAAMAKKFGGGGHKKAAGFIVDGDIKEVLEQILTTI